LLIAAVLFLASLWSHIGMLNAARRVVTPSGQRSVRVSIAYLIVLASHLVITCLFALGFALAVELGLGGFAKEAVVGLMDLFYFSLINITTLGLGDIYPTGHLRAITGIESLTGFMIISCTAQFVFNTMKKQED
jgi:potassium channel LctB